MNDLWLWERVSEVRSLRFTRRRARFGGSAAGLLYPFLRFLILTVNAFLALLGGAVVAR